MHTRFGTRIVVGICLCGLPAVRAATPAGTGFTYQGQLKLGGSPVNGTADLSFELYDASTAGNQIGGTQGVYNVTVSGGLFTVTLNTGGEFGDAFNSQARWLQITVRSPSASGSFVTLSPRQPIMAAPYALGIAGGFLTLDSVGASIYTGTGTSELNRYLNLVNSQGLQSASGLRAGGVLVANDYFFANPGKNDLIVKGQVGIGTAPGSLYRLTIRTLNPGYGMAHTDGVRTVASYLSVSSGGWIGTVSNHAFNLYANNSSPRLTVTPDGNVGIGTTTPNAATQLNVVTSAAGNQAVRGDSANGNGVVGTSAAAGFSATAGFNSNATGIGVYGQLVNPSTINLTDVGKAGVWGDSGDRHGVLGTSSAAGTGKAGVIGISASGYGVYGETRGGAAGGIGVYGSAIGGGTAGFFEGNVTITGNLTANAVFANFKQFRIDHPLDPEHKYLQHACVESPEMKNIYDGVVTTNDQGDATVTLPDWFAALNDDFRYQLTVIGQFAQAIVAEEIHDNRFGIRTDKPRVKVSWQITGVRKDACAKAHPLAVEVDKPAAEQGKYLDPEAFGKSKDLSMHAEKSRVALTARN